MSTEKMILRNLIDNADYCKKVLPFLKDEYFSGAERKVFDTIQGFVLKYNVPPTYDAIKIEMGNIKGLSEPEALEASVMIDDWSTNKITAPSEDWLVNTSEQFCQDKALYLAMTKSIAIMKKDDNKLTKGAIPTILSEALSVTFNRSVGHDYFDDAMARYDFYHRVDKKVPFDLDLMNKITKGGIPVKTLNILLAGTGVGKSLFMCHYAASCLNAGLNVLYITLEMSEENIGKRIDANLLNVSLSELESIPKNMYENMMGKLRAKTHGRLIIEEYPTASASVQHFRTLLNELRLKKNFTPDIIFVDYLNICTSSRIKPGASVNSYTYIKAIAEELRGLAVEYDVPVFSATQTTRTGYGSSDVELTDTSESFGLPATADFMFALISSEELDALGQIMVKQLKNRYNDPTAYKRFVLGIDRSKMRLYNLDASAQNGISDSGQPSQSAPKINSGNKPGANRFGGIKV